MFDFFADGELPAPAVTAAEAARIARALGVTDPSTHELGSQQDANALVLGPNGPVAVLKVTNPAFGDTAVRMQDDAADLVAVRTGLRTPRRQHRVGDGILVDTIDGRPHVARLIDHLDGGTLTGDRYLRPAVVARLGEIAADVVTALADLDHPHLDAVLQWNLWHAMRVVELLAAHVPDEERGGLVRAAANAWSIVTERSDRLPVQAIHGDLTDDNVVVDAEGLPDGAIDFGDVMRSWRVAELAVTISSVLHHDGATAASTVPAVVAFDRRVPLTDDEIEVLWPLVVLRAAALVVSGHQQVALDPDHAYAAAGLRREGLILAVATSVPTVVMTALFRRHLGRPVATPTVSGTLLPAGTTVEVADLSVTSARMDGGAWLETGGPVVTSAVVGGADVVVEPFGQVDATRIPALSMDEPASVVLRATVHPAMSVDLVAPWAGDVVAQPGRTELHTDDQVLSVCGEVAHVVSGPVVPGQVWCRLQGSAEIQVAPATLVDDVPEAVTASVAAGWLAVLSDPGPLLGLPSPPPREDDLLARRDRVLAGTQEHYYAFPPRIERGWRHHLLSTSGRSYLDIVNNVTMLGHGRPEIAEAVAAQWRLLNTNSRFHYGAIVEFAERLAALLPDPLDTVYLVNSGSEAVDLALRLATIATGRPDLVAVREAYHGWTHLSDAVSTSIADNPRALETRPAWVHTVDSPNSYRGRHRGVDARRYAPEAVAVIEELVAAGTPPAAFVAEAFYGNAGGVPLPDGYLREVYAAVRAAGGLAVADEIQVGLGRLGHWFWGFEQQGVVPDVVTVAKALGNGHPVAAVVTTAEVASRYRDEGYFFSSTGGSPVSAVVGSTVLDVLAAEDLPGNARSTGQRLKSGLEALMDRHGLIGAVHGSGLYLGVEFVRDRRTLEPATAETARICERMLALGVVVQPTGDHQNVLKIKPPMCLDEPAADFFVAALDRALTTGS